MMLRVQGLRARLWQVEVGGLGLEEDLGIGVNVIPTLLQQRKHNSYKGRLGNSILVSTGGGFRFRHSRQLASGWKSGF